MEKQYSVRTIIVRTIAIWLITVSVTSFFLEVSGPAFITNMFKTLAVVGVAVGAVILATTIHRWQTKELVRAILKRNRLFSVIVGVGVSVALTLSLRRLDYPFSLPSGLLSGFAAGFTLYKLRSGIRKTWVRDSVIVGFTTYFIISLLFRLSTIFLSENFGWAQFVFILVILGEDTLAAILWGTVSSIAGHLISSVKRRLILFGVIALGVASFLSPVLTQITAEPLFGASVPFRAESWVFSLEGMEREISSIVVQGIILTCFLSIFQRKEILKKIDFHKNLASLPLGIKILVAYGIFTWLAFAFYVCFSGTLGIYPQYGIISVLVLAGTFLTFWTFLRKPSTGKGFLLFGFILASIQAILLLFVVPFYGTNYTWMGLANVKALLVPIFFSILMILWLHIEKMRVKWAGFAFVAALIVSSTFFVFTSQQQPALNIVDGIGVSARAKRLQPSAITVHVTVHNLTDNDSLLMGNKYTPYINNESWDGGESSTYPPPVIPAGATRELEYSFGCVGIQGIVTIKGIVIVNVSGENIEVPYSAELTL